jgi:hypothetical protein
MNMPNVCSLAMNYCVSLSLTNRKSSVHLHALYSPRTALRTFTPRRDQLVICGQYIHKRSVQICSVECTCIAVCCIFVAVSNMYIVYLFKLNVVIEWLSLLLRSCGSPWSEHLKHN